MNTTMAPIINGQLVEDVPEVGALVVVVGFAPAVIVAEGAVVGGFEIVGVLVVALAEGKEVAGVVDVATAGVTVKVPVK